MLCCINTVTLLPCQNWGVCWVMCSTMWIFQFQGMLFCPQTLLQRFTECELKVCVPYTSSTGNHWKMSLTFSWWPLLLRDTWLHLVLLGISYTLNASHQGTSVTIAQLRIAESTNNWGRGFSCSMGWNLQLSSWGRSVDNSSEPAFWHQWVIQKQSQSMVWTDGIYNRCTPGYMIFHDSGIWWSCSSARSFCC